MMFGRASVCFSAAAFLLVGCSAKQTPRAEIATAEMALRQARQSAAPQHSPLELRNATEKLNRAKQAMADEDYMLARRLAEQALVDAQLAQATAQSFEAQRMTTELRESIEALRREAERKADAG